MEPKDKELLLKDLCARSPYGVICSIYRVDDWNVGWRDEKLSGYFYDGKAFEFYFGETPISIDNDISKVRPYLRPMSSMTKDEREEIEVFICDKYFIDDSGSAVKVDKTGFIEFLSNYDCSGIYPDFCGDFVDWLNAHYLDYRGLIKKGLALKAPEGMYDIR